DHPAGAIVRDAYEVLSETRSEADEQALPAADRSEPAVMMRVDAARHPGPPRGRHGIQERPVIVRVNDIEAFLLEKPSEPPPQSRPKAPRLVERQNANPGCFDRVGQNAARTEDDHRPVEARSIRMARHLDEEAFLPADLQPQRDL